MLRKIWRYKSNKFILLMEQKHDSYYYNLPEKNTTLNSFKQAPSVLILSLSVFHFFYENDYTRLWFESCFRKRENTRLCKLSKSLPPVAAKSIIREKNGFIYRMITKESSQLVKMLYIHTLHFEEREVRSSIQSGVVCWAFSCDWDEFVQWSQGSMLSEQKNSVWQCSCEIDAKGIFQRRMK